MSTATMDAPRRFPVGAADTPHLSPSIAKILLARSPMHAWDAHRLGGNHKPEQTKAMTDGLIFDRLLFGVGPEIIPIDAPDWRTKAAQTARDQAEAAGFLPILAHKLGVYDAIVRGWRAQFADLGVTLGGEHQVKLCWDDDGVPCKGILDHLIFEANRITIYDLKTCEDSGPDAVANAMVRFGYDVQHAAYVDAVEMTYPEFAGRVEMRFVFCETDRPYAVNVVEPAGSMKALGRYKWRRAVKTWGACLQSGEFPGYAQVTRIEAKPWQLDQAMEEGGCDAASL